MGVASRRTSWALLGVLGAACASGSVGGDGAPDAGPGLLAGTEWRLVEIQSMDDAIGTTVLQDPARFTMALNGDGSVAMALDCNRATGTWLAEPASSPASGTFRFGPLAVTRAQCPPPSLDQRVATQAQYVRSYLLRDGRLYLSLLADAGIQVWEPVGATTPARE